MHQHVDEAVAAVHRPGDGPVRHRTRRFHRTGRAERRRRTRGRVVVDTHRVVAEHVAVEAIAHRFDGLARRELFGPVVPGDDVVHQLADGPVLAVRHVVPLLIADAGDQAMGGVERLRVHFGEIDVHRFLDSPWLDSPWLVSRCQVNSLPGGGGSPRQHRPSMKIHDRRWITLGP